MSSNTPDNASTVRRALHIFLLFSSILAHFCAPNGCAYDDDEDNDDGIYAGKAAWTAAISPRSSAHAIAWARRAVLFRVALLNYF